MTRPGSYRPFTGFSGFAGIFSGKPGNYRMAGRLAIYFFLLLFLMAPAWAATTVTENITQDTVWTVGGNPYVIADKIVVASGITLSIEPGVIVKFDSFGHLSVSGTLNADGSTGDTIYFTSLKDDAAGGDTNGDGNTTAPAELDWLQITLESSSTGNILKNVVIRYGGSRTGSGGAYSVISSGLCISTSSVSTSDVTVEKSYHGVLVIEASPTLSGVTSINNSITGINLVEASDSVISGNTTNENGYYGICVGSNSNRAIISGNTANENGEDGILVGSGGAVISGNNANGNSKFGIVIGSGTNGATVSENTANKNTIYGIFIDFNADGVIISNNIISENGAIGIVALSAGNIEVLSNIITNNNVGVYSGSSSFKINANTIWGNKSYGIRIYGFSTTDILFNEISTNLASGINITDASGNIAINNNKIFMNREYGVLNEKTVAEDAPDNWWGDNSGPFNATTNPAGTGNKISDNVTFSPLNNDLEIGLSWQNFSAAAGSTYGSITPPVLTQGSLSDEWDSSSKRPDRTMAFDSQEVILDYTGLASTESYKIRVSYFNPDSVGGKQRLTDGNGVLIHDDMTMPASDPMQYEFVIPATSYANGNLRLRFINSIPEISGSRAVVPEIWLMQFTPGAGKAPMITDIDPATNSFLTASPNAVTVTFTSADSTLDTAASILSVTDENQVEVTGTRSVTANRFIFTPAVPFADSAYTIHIRLVDNNGNRGPDACYHFTLDTVAPAAPVIVNPVTTPTSTSTSDQTISGTKEAYAAVLLNDTEIIGHTAETAWEWPVTLSEGENLLKFKARDQTGNVSEEAVVTIVLDTTSPAAVQNLTVTIGSDGSSAVLDWNGYDETLAGNISQYRVYAEKTEFSDVTGLAEAQTVDAGQFTCTVRNLDRDTLWYFAVVPVDQAGNAINEVTPVSAATPAWAATTVTGNISQDMVWTIEGSPYIINSGITVGSGITLTVEPGVIVKFDSGGSLNISGTLKADGTAGDTIYFTSLKDDAVGGDTNGDGPATTPAEKNWGGLVLDASSTGNVLKNAVIRYGGTTGGGLYIKTSNIITNDLTVEKSFYGIRVEGCSPTLSGITSVDNTNTGFFLVSTDNAVLTDNTSNGDTLAFFLMNTNNAIISDNIISGNTYSGISLTISNNTVISNNVVSGNGQEGIYISGNTTYTIIKNNTIDGIFKKGIYLEDVNNTTIVTNTIFNNSIGIHCKRSTTSNIMSNAIWGNRSYGIQIDGASDAHIFFNEISTNKTSGFYILDTSVAVINNNRIFMNWPTGIFNLSNNVMDTSDNWWGDNSGPYHSTANPAGTGNKIFGNVTFSPLNNDLEIGLSWHNFSAAAGSTWGSITPPVLTQGALSDEWDSSSKRPDRTIAWDSQEVILDYTGLTATESYKIRVSYFNFDSVGGKQRLTDGNGVLIHDDMVMPVSNPLQYEFVIPATSYANGNLRLRFINSIPEISGSRAVVPEIWLMQFTPGADKAPMITDIDPAGNASLNTSPNAVTVTFTSADSTLDTAASILSVTDENQVEVTGTRSVTANQFIFTPAVPFAGSAYTIHIRLVDNNGNRGPDACYHFTLDTVAPAAPVINPVTTPTSTSDQTISGTKEAYASILLNGTEIIGHTAETGWEWPVTLSDGENHLKFNAKNQNGKISEDTIVTIVFDDTPPDVTLAVPLQVQTGSSFTIKINATDNIGVDSVALYIDNLHRKTFKSEPYEIGWNVGQAGETLSIRAEALDAAGNKSEATATVTVTDEVDSTPPVIETFLVPSSAAPGKTVTVRANISDDHGVAEVRFSMGETLLGTLVTPPYEMTFTIPGDTATGTSLTIWLNALDAAGNLAPAKRNIVVSDTADTEPPVSVSISVPPEALAGQTIHLTASAEDNIGILKTVFLADNTVIGTDSELPYEATYIVPADKAAGDQISFVVQAFDFSGNQTLSDPAVLTVKTPSEGFIAGEVYNNRTGLPLEKITVSLVSINGESPESPVETQTDARGRYHLQSLEGSARILISKADYMPVYREINVVPGDTACPPDARLTSREKTFEVNHLVGGTFDTDTDKTAILDIPAGTFSEETSLGLTLLNGQGLPASLPPGWTPVFALCISPSGKALNAPVSLSVYKPEEAVNNNGLVAVRWDAETFRWIRVDSALNADGNATVIRTGYTGTVALVRPDTEPEAPAIPLSGEILTGVNPVSIPDDAAAEILPTPEIIFMQSGSPADVQTSVTAARQIPSGTRIRVRFTESYLRTDGTSLSPDSMIQDMFLYQKDTGAAADFVAAPSESIDPVRLTEGKIRLEALTSGTDTGTGMTGPSGNTIELPDGLSLTFPAGATADNIPVISELVTAPDTLGNEKTNFEIMPLSSGIRAGVSIDMGTTILAQGATLTLDTGATVSESDCFLLVSPGNIKGETRQVLVSVGSVEENHVTFGGIRTTGLYFIIKMKIPVGYITGTITLEGAGTQAFAETGGLSFISLTEAANPVYFLVSPVGNVTVSVRDINSGAAASKDVTISAAGDTVTADLSLEPVLPTVTNITFSEHSEKNQNLVDINASITAVFSAKINAATIIPANFTLSAGSVDTGGTAALSEDGFSAVFRPAAPLSDSTTYTVSLTENIQDIYGNPLEPYAIQFSTEDLTPPETPTPGKITISIPAVNSDGKMVTTITCLAAGTVEPGTIVTAVNKTTNERTDFISENGSFEFEASANISDNIVLEFMDTSDNISTYDPGPFTDKDGTVVIGADGGTVTGSGNTRVIVPAGVLENGTPVKVSAVETSDLSLSIPPDFRFLGGIEIGMNDAIAKEELKASIWIDSDNLPAGFELTEDSQIIVVEEDDFDGTLEYNLINIAHVIEKTAEGIRVETASPPFVGIRQSGKYPFLFSTVKLNFAEIAPSPLMTCCSVGMVCQNFSLRSKIEDYISICIAVPENRSFKLTTYGPTESGFKEYEENSLPSDTFGKLYVPPINDNEDLKIDNVGVAKDAVINPAESNLSVIFSKLIPPDFLNTNTVKLYELDEKGNRVGTVEGQIVLLCDKGTDKAEACSETDDTRLKVRGVHFEPALALKYDTGYQLVLEGIKDYGENPLRYGFDETLLVNDDEPENILETARPFRTFRPGYLGSLDMENPGDICVVDDYTIAIADNTNGKGVVLVDVTNPLHPRITARTASVVGPANAVYAKKNFHIDDNNVSDIIMAVTGTSEDFGALHIYSISDDRKSLPQKGAWAFTTPAFAVQTAYEQTGTLPYPGRPFALALRGDNLYVPTIGIGVIRLTLSGALQNLNGDPGDLSWYFTDTPGSAALAGELLLIGENSRLLFLTSELKNIGGGERETVHAEFMVKDIETVLSQDMNLAFVAAIDKKDNSEDIPGLYIFDLPKDLSNPDNIPTINTEPVSRIRLSQIPRAVGLKKQERLAYVTTPDHIWVADVSDPHFVAKTEDTEGTEDADDEAVDDEDPRILGTVGGMGGGQRLAMGTNLGFATDIARNRVNIFSTSYCPLQSVTLEDGTNSVSPGQSAQARITPVDEEVIWRLEIPEDKEGKINATINENGIIQVQPESVCGTWIRVVAIRKNQPGCVAETEIYIGCLCSDCQKPGSGNFDIGSFQDAETGKNVNTVDVRLGTGKGKNGKGGCSISLNTGLNDENIYSPDALEYNCSESDSIEVREKGALRQIMAPETFTDIVKTGQDSYEVRFYSAEDATRTDEDELFVVNKGAEPFSVWQIKNPDTGGNSASVYRLKVSETVGKTESYEYQMDTESQTGSMKKGGGLETVEKKTRTVSGLIEETETVRGASGNVISSVKTAYKTFPWGKSFVSRIEDPDGAALKTVWTYYETAGSGYGQVKKRTNPDGSWIEYEYDSENRIVRETRPFLDSDTIFQVTEYDYTPVNSEDLGNAEDKYKARTVIEKTNGKETGRTFHIYTRNSDDGSRKEITRQCVSPGAFCEAPENLSTVREYAAWNPAAPDSARLKKVTRPDGSVSTYEYKYGTYTEGSPDSFSQDDSGQYLRQISETESAGQKTRQTSISDATGHTVLNRTEVYTRDNIPVMVSQTITEYDFRGRPEKITNLDGTYEEQAWGCCNIESRTGADGLKTTYTYDALKRVITETRESLNGDIITVYDYIDNETGPKNIQTVNAGEGSPSFSSETQSDHAGRTVYSKDQAGLVTSYSYEDNGLKTTVTRPGAITEITERHLDGRTRTVSGTGVIPMTYTYGVTSPEGLQWTRTDTDSMWEKSYADMLGRTVKTEKPGYKSDNPLITNTFYDDMGRTIKTETTLDGKAVQAPALYVYDTVTGEQYRSGTDIDENGTLEPKEDRITETRTYFTETDGTVWQVTEQFVYDTDGNKIRTGMQKNRMITAAESSGSYGLLIAESVSVDINGNETKQYSYVNREAKTQTSIAKYPDAVNEAISVTQGGLPVSGKDKSGITVTYGYDALGRRTKVFDPRLPEDKPMVTAYDAAGRVDYVQDAAGNKTEFVYDPATGRKIAEKNALGKFTRYAYNERNQVTNVWGHTTYPVKYEYDTYGRLEKMHTFRGGSGWNGDVWPATTGDPDTTEWDYDDITGLLTAKTYADGKQTTYDYTADGKLKTRIWARNNGLLTTGYEYKDKTGELENINYSDDTPGITFEYDLLGRQTYVKDAAGERTFEYDPNTLALTGERIDGASIYGAVALTRKYENGTVKGRPSGFGLKTGDAETEEYSISYGYDETTGRFNNLEWRTAGDKTGVVAYSYVPDSNLLESVTSGGLETKYSYEAKRNLKTQVRNSWNGSSIISQYDYKNDKLGRRESVENSGNAFTQTRHNIYSYNDRNEVTGSVRKEGTVENPVATVDSEGRLYEYDPIGNRTRATEGNATPQLTTYTTDVTNRYTALSGGVSASPAYDDDGNMTAYNGATYTWNAENRLVSVEKADKKITFLYDYMGRRVQKKVFGGTPGSWNIVPDETRVFVYDGWNLIKETVTGDPNGDTYYVWGLDLSQSMQGAGGIGGLVCRVSGTAVRHYTYDANGNVGQLVDEAGAIVAHYEYDPFGNEIRAEGDDAQNNPFRFSTKYWDDETGFYYYGFRYYLVELGRWLSRDPIGEWGGINLYATGENSPTTKIDILGLDVFLLFFSTDQGDSGSGHVGIAVGEDVNKDMDFYEANPSVSASGVPYDPNYHQTGKSLNDIYEKTHNYLSHKEIPDVVARLKTCKEEDKKVLEILENWFKKNKKWEVNATNCADLVKAALKGTKYDGGYANAWTLGIISTPQELADDIWEDHKEEFKNGDITVLKGNLKEYGNTSGVYGVIKNHSGKKYDAYLERKKKRKKREGKVNIMP